MPIRRAACAGFAAIMLFCGAPGLADAAPSAADAFEAGRAAFDQGDYAAAARHFEDAHRLEPAGAALFNAARAWILADERARAADALAAASTVPGFAPDAEKKAAALLASLREELAQLRVEGPADLRVNVVHVERASLPLTTHLEPGRHTLRIEDRDGSERAQEIEVDAGEKVFVELSAPAGSRPEVPGPPPPSIPPEPTGGDDAFVIAGWISVGVGAAAGGVGAVLGAMALSARGDFLDSDRLDLAARERSADLRTATNVVWIAGGVVALGGVSLLVWQAVDGGAGSASVSVSPGSVGLFGAF